MDPLTIIGGIVATGQAAEVVGSCASALYQISCKAGVLEEEVELFASNVHVFGSTVSQAHRTIRDHYLNDNTSTMIQKLNKSSVLDSLAFQCECVMKRVESLQKRVSGHNRAPDFVARFLWLLNKEKRDIIYLTMDRIKMSFFLIISQVMYEVLERRSLNPSALERRLCNFSKEMYVLRSLME
jgi:hypothetical protein